MCTETREIETKYSNDTQCKRAMLEEWRNHHPAPSWRLVADDLYCGRSGDKYGKYHEVLQQVKVKYLKGKKIITLANLMVSLKYAH